MPVGTRSSILARKKSANLACFMLNTMDARAGRSKTRIARSDGWAVQGTLRKDTENKHTNRKRVGRETTKIAGADAWLPHPDILGYPAILIGLSSLARARTCSFLLDLGSGCCLFRTCRSLLPFSPSVPALARNVCKSTILSRTASTGV